MRKWEDIVKDKLEASEGALPESVLAEFHARREAAAATAAPKRFPWVWVAVPAVAAGLAAVLLLRQPSVPTDGVQLIDQPSAPVAVVTEVEPATEVSEVTEVTEVAEVANVVRKVKPTPVVEPTKVVAAPEEVDVPKEADTPKEIEPAKEVDTPTEVAPATEDVVEQAPVPTVSSPFIPEQPAARKVQMKVGPATGIIGGGGLLAAAGGLLLVKGSAAGGGRPTFTAPAEDKLVGNPVHYFPIRVGLSVGIPVSRRWFLSTGLNYSLYLSSFTYKIAGEKKQAAHYLGVPVRMNWIFATNRFMDVYVGAGLEGDVCLNAGGFNLSLQGVGGIQFNPTGWLGIYIEPELGWRIPMSTPTMETYRSQHPLMFSVAAGLRFRIQNKH